MLKFSYIKAHISELQNYKHQVTV